MATVKKKSKSVLKRQRQTKKKTLRNQSVKSELKTWIKNVNTVLEAGKIDEARTLMATLASRLDKAVKKGVIHKNKAANHKSSMMKKINKAATAGTKTPAVG